MDRRTRRRSSAALFLTTLLIASSLVAAVSAGTFPGSNGKIAFAGGGEIEVINPDGTGRAELTTTSVGGESEPAWNATGTKLVFSEGHSFSTMNADGSNRTPLFSHDTFAGNPTWSPDGGVVAFDGFIGTMQGSRIFVVPAAGGTATELVDLDAEDPTYSPDGTKIAFELFADNHNIGVMNADGSSAASITSGASGNSGDFDPSWSPDGTKIAFTRADQIWTMNADGSGAIQLTTGTDASYPTWSPDGTKIAFERDADIWVMDGDGSDAVNITNTTDVDEKEPDWGICTGAGCPPPPAQCSVTWDGGAGTAAWHDAANWDTDALPGVGDGVCIFDQNPDLTVTHSEGTTQIASLFAQQPFTLSGGTLELQDTTRHSFIDPCCTFTLSGGTLSGAATLEVGRFDWRRGEMRGPGTTVIGVGTALDPLSPCCTFSSVSHRLSGGRTLINKGAIKWTRGEVIVNDLLNTEIINDGYLLIAGQANSGCCGLRIDPFVEGDECSCTFTNNGTFEIPETTAQVPETRFSIWGPGTRFVNHGTIVTGPADYARGGRFSAEDFTNTGRVRIEVAGTSDPNYVSWSSKKYVQTGGTTILHDPQTEPCEPPGAIIHTSACPFLKVGSYKLRGGSLVGKGSIKGDVINSAVVDPRDDLRIFGRYTQTDEGELRVTLGKDQVVSDSMRLGGTLDVRGGKKGLRQGRYKILTGTLPPKSRFKDVEAHGLASDLRIRVAYGRGLVTVHVERRKRR